MCDYIPAYKRVKGRKKATSSSKTRQKVITVHKNNKIIIVINEISIIQAKYTYSILRESYVLMTSILFSAQIQMLHSTIYELEEQILLLPKIPLIF